MMYALRLTFAGFVFAVCIQVQTSSTAAQQVTVDSRAGRELLDAPDALTSWPEDFGTLRGMVMDSSGAVIAGTSITLEATTSADIR
jgi:hypothetical protein